MFLDNSVATVPTACGIETHNILKHNQGSCLLQQCLPLAVLKHHKREYNAESKLQQYLPFTVCDEGCEAVEEQSDDEVCTSLVPDQREEKTKVMME